jgi:hypothetical protein
MLPPANPGTSPRATAPGGALRKDDLERGGNDDHADEPGDRRFEAVEAALLEEQDGERRRSERGRVKFPGSTLATAGMNAGPGNGHSARSPERSP